MVSPCWGFCWERGYAVEAGVVGLRRYKLAMLPPREPRRVPLRAYSSPRLASRLPRPPRRPRPREEAGGTIEDDSVAGLVGASSVLTPLSWSVCAWASFSAASAVLCCASCCAASCCFPAMRELVRPPATEPPRPRLPLGGIVPKREKRRDSEVPDQK